MQTLPVLLNPFISSIEKFGLMHEIYENALNGIYVTNETQEFKSMESTKI